MSDNYPRVLFGTSTWMPAANGAHKVVPVDAIVIESHELPPVIRGHVRAAISGGYGYSDPDAAHDAAVALLAIEAELRARPPVDEREVEVLGQVLSDEDKGRRGHDDASWVDIARRLLATGKVHVDTEAGAR